MYYTKYLLLLPKLENYNMPYAKGRVVTPRPRINTFAMVYLYDSSGDAAARASETPTQNETSRDQRTTQDFTNRLILPLPTIWVWSHITVCGPASILHTEQNAESVEAAEDWTISPSASRYLRDVSYWPGLHSQPQVD